MMHYNLFTYQSCKEAEIDVRCQFAVPERFDRLWIIIDLNPQTKHYETKLRNFLATIIFFQFVLERFQKKNCLINSDSFLWTHSNKKKDTMQVKIKCKNITLLASSDFWVGKH